MPVSMNRGRAAKAERVAVVVDPEQPEIGCSIRQFWWYQAACEVVWFGLPPGPTIASSNTRNCSLLNGFCSSGMCRVPLLEGMAVSGHESEGNVLFEQDVGNLAAVLFRVDADIHQRAVEVLLGDFA